MVALGGSITGATGGWASRLPSHFHPGIFGSSALLSYINSGVGGTPSWYGLIRLQTDVIDYSPSLVFVDFAVNGDGGAVGDRIDQFKPAKEALIRRLITALPNAMIVAFNFVYPDGYSYYGGSREDSDDEWHAMTTHYGIIHLDWGSYLETLMPAPYDDADVEAYLSGVNNVHPNTAGHLAAYNLMASTITQLTAFQGALPTRYWSEAADYEATPIIRDGTDNDGETGAWATNGTARESSTATSTIQWTGTFCSFGLDTNVGGGAGVLEWDVDGGGYTQIDLSAKSGSNYAVYNFARSEHTVTIRVVSGTVRINRFMAV